MEYTEIQKIIEKAKTEYKTIGKVFCPYLGQQINFTERGFNHLIYKDRDMRPYNEINVRLDSLKFVPKILSKSGTLQEYEKRDVQYFGFIAIINSKKYKVVILKDTAGEYRFVSIIPKYRTGIRDIIKKPTQE